MRRVLLLLAFGTVLLQSGCVNNYSKFYTPDTRGPNSKTQYAPYSGSSMLVRSGGDNVADAQAMLRKGFLPLGYSSFEGGVAAGSDKDVLEFAKQIGADLVIVKGQFLRSDHGAVPIIQYNPGQTSTTVSTGSVNSSVYTNTGASAYGRATYNGMSTTTSPGTYTTQMMPVTIHRYEYGASFWRKGKRPVLGVHFSPLDDALRQQYQRNTGLVVRVVVDESPAFKANILVGDVIIGIADKDVAVPADFSALMDENAGKPTDFRVLRGTEEKTINVVLNPREPTKD